MNQSRPLAVLLGASNLTRGVSALVDCARARLGGPIDYYFAFGNGRSYGMRSRVFFRDLPGIRDCGLWDALATRRGTPAYGLIADIGNDVLYEATNAAIKAWLVHSLDQLAALEARTVIVQLPLAIIRNVTPAQFEYARRVLFPARQLELASLQAKAEELAEIVRTLAKEYGAALIEQKRGWYGFDPIHYRIKLWREIWHEVTAPWSDGRRAAARPEQSNWRQWAYLRSRVPNQRWIFGYEQCAVQPCGVLGDGSSVSIY